TLSLMACFAAIQGKKASELGLCFSRYVRGYENPKVCWFESTPGHPSTNHTGHKQKGMSRKKVSDSERLTRKIGLRVSGPFYEEMKTLLSKSNCRSVAELARHVLYKKR